MKPDLISIVMPLYNHVSYVEESIQSILNQSHSNIELIIVDDGSTDGSSDIAKKYEQLDKRVQYFFKENGGTGSALNLGFKHATGKYGTWVSSDNFHYVDMIAVMVEFLNNHPESEFVFSAFDIYHGKKFVMKHELPAYKQPLILHAFVGISYHICITGICYLFSMDLKNKCGEYINIPGEDYYMGVKMGLETNVGYIPTSLGGYREHSDSVSGRLIENPSLHLNGDGLSAVQLVKNLIKEKGIV